MNTLSANEAKIHFGDMLLKAQRGKPVAVVISAAEYADIEAIKLQVLQSRAVQARADIAAGKLIDGESFFDELQTDH